MSTEVLVVSAICDFCSTPDVRWAYPARDFDMKIAAFNLNPENPRSMLIDWHSSGSWASCPACHALIQRGLRDKLVVRSAKRMTRNHPISMRRATRHIRELHDGFWSNREGDPVTTTPGSPDPFKEAA